MINFKRKESDPELTISTAEHLCFYKCILYNLTRHSLPRIFPAGLFHFTPTFLPFLPPLRCKPFKATNRQHEWLYGWGLEQSQTCSGCYGWERLQPKWHKTGFHQDRCGHQRQTRAIAKACVLFIQAFWCCWEVIDGALVLSVLCWKAPFHSHVLDITVWQRQSEDVQLGCLSKYQDCCGTNYIILRPADGHVYGFLLFLMKKNWHKTSNFHSIIFYFRRTKMQVQLRAKRGKKGEQKMAMINSWSWGCSQVNLYGSIWPWFGANEQMERVTNTQDSSLAGEADNTFLLSTVIKWYPTTCTCTHTPMHCHTLAYTQTIYYSRAQKRKRLKKRP